jgi:hypothetical protein
LRRSIRTGGADTTSDKGKTMTVLTTSFHPMKSAAVSTRLGHQDTDIVTDRKVAAAMILQRDHHIDTSEGVPGAAVITESARVVPGIRHPVVVEMRRGGDTDWALIPKCSRNAVIPAYKFQTRYHPQRIIPNSSLFFNPRAAFPLSPHCTFSADIVSVTQV